MLHILKRDVAEHIAWLKGSLNRRSFVGDARDIYERLDSLKSQLNEINAIEYIERNERNKEEQRRKAKGWW
jgi:hypothetical protein